MPDRPRIAPGDYVRHCDGREGIVLDLATVDGLPAAVVDFEGGREELALGYLERVATAAGTGR